METNETNNNQLNNSTTEFLLQQFDPGAMSDQQALHQRNLDLVRQNQELISTVTALTGTVGNLERQVTELTTQLKALLGDPAKKIGNSTTGKAPSNGPTNPVKKRKTDGSKILLTNQIDESLAAASALPCGFANSAETARTVSSQNSTSSTLSTASVDNGTRDAENNAHNDEIDLNNIGWSLATNKRNGANKIAPIQLEFMCSDKKTEIISGLSDHVGADNFKWMQKRVGSAPKIYCKNNANKDKIQSWLDSKQVQFNTFADDTNRLKSFIVRGICCGADSDNIQSIEEAIASRGIQAGFTVSRFITGSQKRSENEVNILYRITVPHDLDDQLLRGIRTIGIFGVKVEPLKNRSVVQCYNCQRFSHTARQCHFIYRCVKCCSQHPAGSCPRNTNPNIPVACINCKEDGLQHTGHSANQYGSCNFFKKNFKGDESNRLPTSINRRPLEKPQSSVTLQQQTTRASRSQQNTGPIKVGSLNQQSSSGTKPGQFTWAQIAGGKRVDDPMLQMMTVFRELLPKLIQIGECFQL